MLGFKTPSTIYTDCKEGIISPTISYYPLAKLYTSPLLSQNEIWLDSGYCRMLEREGHGHAEDSGPCSLLLLLAAHDSRGHFGTNQKICWTTRVGSRSVRDDGQGYRHGRHAPRQPPSSEEKNERLLTTTIYHDTQPTT
jgi:hypothetical protein